MSISTSTGVSDFFVAGGTLRPDTPSYVERPTDDELFDLALAGEFCYVLTPRQMGKSSLMIRTARRLQEQGVQTAIIDLTRIGAGANVEQWYLSLLTQFARRLRLSTDPVAWWQERAALGDVQRFTDFLCDVILAEVEGQIVVFIDEIDTTLKLDFRDDFFAAIRAMYNARAADAEFERLTFVLLGVASPPDLIKDRARTPFNIGHGVALQEFTRTDADALRQELEAIYPGQGEAIFVRIYHWTNGHPYLTQKLCLTVAETREGEWADERVDELVEELFLSEAARKESNLQFVQDKVLSHPQRRELLNLYKQTLGGREIRDDGQSLVQNHLKLSGLVKVESGVLRVRNEIYRRVFDLAWVKEHTAINWAPIVAGVALFVALLAVGAILYNAWVGIRLDGYVAGFYQTVVPEERLAYLARILRLRGLFGPTDYDYKARELFFGLSTTEQLALFDAYDVADLDLIEIVGELYVMGGDTPLLEAMNDSIGRLDGTENEAIQEEINCWLRGRALARQGQYDDARVEYDRAVARNDENPATRYERARVLIELSEYQLALSDLDRVVAIARSVPSPSTPTPPPATLTPVEHTPSGQTPHTGATPTQFSTSAIPTVTLTLPPDSTETPALAPTPTATPTPTVIPDESIPIISEFTTWGEMISAIRSLIHSTPGLVSSLAGALSEEYSNLREAGLVSSAGATQTRATDDMLMVFAPGGTFLMGSDESDSDADSDEFPQHPGTLDAFWIDRTEVSVAQFRQFVTETGYETDAEREGWGYVVSGTVWLQGNGADWQHPQGPDSDAQDDHPVIQVSWNDAVAYCEWAGARLPTEAEWEYAARGAQSLIYPWGNEFDGTRLNYCDANCEFDWADETANDGYAGTAPVGSYPSGASWCDALDMAGNVWEWAADWYGDYPSGAQTNPTGPAEGEFKVLRGGGWDNVQRDVRASYRNNVYPGYRYVIIGFRCVAVAPGQ